jgi:hypothetical protein
VDRRAPLDLHDARIHDRPALSLRTDGLVVGEGVLVVDPAVGATGDDQVGEYAQADEPPIRSAPGRPDYQHWFPGLAVLMLLGVFPVTETFGSVVVVWPGQVSIPPPSMALLLLWRDVVPVRWTVPS